MQINKHAGLGFLFTFKTEIDPDSMAKKGLSMRFNCTFGFSNIHSIYFGKQNNSSGKFTAFPVFFIKEDIQLRPHEFNVWVKSFVDFGGFKKLRSGSKKSVFTQM